MSDQADCCPHEGRDEKGCWDCYNTGHAHAYDPDCPNPPFGPPFAHPVFESQDPEVYAAAKEKDRQDAAYVQAKLAELIDVPLVEGDEEGKFGTKPGWL